MNPEIIASRTIAFYREARANSSENPAREATNAIAHEYHDEHQDYLHGVIAAYQEALEQTRHPAIAEMVAVERFAPRRGFPERSGSPDPTSSRVGNVYLQFADWSQT